ncbi:MAG: TolC family protein [Holophagae bacterium]|jgi:outer membrane protein TolC
MRSSQQLTVVTLTAAALMLLYPAVSSAENGAEAPAASAERIVVSIADRQLRLLLEEVLERNPGIARLHFEAAAAEQRAPQVKGPPDPVASLTWWVMPPQTRTGPQQAAVSISQRLPWFGTLKLREQAALWEAAAARARVEAARLEAVTEVRTDYLELYFLDRERRIVGDQIATLEHYSQLALARYASGVGIDQTVIKIDAEITRSRARLVTIAERRATIVARLNALRDRPQTTPIAVSSGATEVPRLEPDLEALRELALASRPEMAAAAAAVEAASVRQELAHTTTKPDLVFALNYGFVGPRDDAAGRLNPPEGDGDDVLGLSAGLSLPVWRAAVGAAAEEGVQRRLAAEEGRREAAAVIDRELGELTHRLPLLAEQVDLYGGVLATQARASLDSAESAYAAGTAGALDLLDAERVVLQVRVASERARTDLAVAWARLEGAVAAPLEVGS